MARTYSMVHIERPVVLDLNSSTLGECAESQTAPASSRRHHDAPDADHLLFLHRVANYRERLLSDLVHRREIVGRFTKAVVNRCLRHELPDFSGVRALDREFCQLLIFDLDVLVLAYLVAFNDIFAGNGLPSLRVDWSLIRLPVLRLSRLKLTFSLARGGRRVDLSAATTLTAMGGTRDAAIPLVYYREAPDRL